MGDWLLEQINDIDKCKDAKVSVNSTTKSLKSSKISTDNNNSSKKIKTIVSKNNVLQFDEMKLNIDNIDLCNLIWAKCFYYWDVTYAFFPAIIMDKVNGGTMSNDIVPIWPIPEDDLLVQFISLPTKAKNQYAVVPKSMTFPYDKEFIKSKLNNENQSWNVKSIDSMTFALGSKHSDNDKKNIVNKIMSCANEVLKNVKSKKNKKRSRNETTSSTDNQVNINQSQHIQDSDGDIVKLAKILNSNPTGTLVAGDWIAYSNHVFREHTVYTRIREVIPSNKKKPLILENNEIIKMTDSIKKCDPLNEANDECIKESGYYNELRYFTLQESTVD